MNKKNILLSMAFICTQFSSLLAGQSPFVCENLSLQNSMGTREFKGLNFSMNKAGHAMAVWAVTDPDPDSGSALTGAIQAAYFDGTSWSIPAAYTFISDTANTCCLPWVHLNDNDQAVAVWHRTDSDPKEIRANRSISGTGAWQVSSELVAALDAAPADFNTERSRVLVGINNDIPAKAFVIWLEEVATNNNGLFYSYNTNISGNTWETKTRIPDPFFIDFPVYTLNPLGHSLCVGDNKAFFCMLLL